MTADGEVVLGTIDGLHVWDSPKPRTTLIGTFRGRLLLTNRRLMFLSIGSSGLAKAIGYTLVLGGLGLVVGQTKTEQLDLAALQNEGSLDLPLGDVASIATARRWDFSAYLTVQTTAGKEMSFMTKMGWNKGELDRFRDEAVKAKSGGPYR